MQPEFRLALATADMHMHWFYWTPFVRVEKEPKSFGAKNHWHSFHLSKSLRRLSLFCEIGKKYPPPNADNFAYFVGCFTRVLIVASTPFSVNHENSIRMAAMCCLTVGGPPWRCKVRYIWSVAVDDTLYVRAYNPGTLDHCESPDIWSHSGCF